MAFHLRERLCLSSACTWHKKMILGKVSVTLKGVTAEFHLNNVIVIALFAIVSFCFPPAASDHLVYSSSLISLHHLNMPIADSNPLQNERDFSAFSALIYVQFGAIVWNVSDHRSCSLY